MVEQSLEAAKGLDFVSVSFGYTEDLWRFWQACGFQLVRFGSQREASSGCYTAMAIVPLSEQAQGLAYRASRQMQRDWPWLQQLIPDAGLVIPASEDQVLEDDDWRELAGFAWGHRPFESSIGSLARLLSEAPGEYPLLSGTIISRLSATDLSQQFGLTGRKAVQRGWRQEAQRAMNTLDQPRSARWQAYLNSLN